MDGGALEGLDVPVAVASDAQRQSMAEQGPIGRVVVDCVQPARDTSVAGMSHDDRRCAQLVKGCGGREQFQLDFIVGVRSRRDQSVQDAVPHAQINCAFCIRLRWNDVVCNFYDSLGFATSEPSRTKY
jgi:hypothetical protein